MPVETMRACVFNAQGIGRVAEVPRPVPAAGEVLVRIHASGVNPLDLKIKAGAAPHARQPLPAILGMDFAGVIKAVGGGVEAFRGGDAVYGMAGGVGGLQGSLAEFAAVDARLVAPKPATLSMHDAASLPLAFITAWEGLIDRAKLQAGQTVLVQGGAGGVGQIAVQIARALGAEVYAVDGAAKASYLRGLGATLIDREEDVSAYVDGLTGGRGFDVVYDTVGGTVLDASFRAVARFGHVVSALGWGTHALAPLSFKAASYSGVFALLPLLTNEGRAHHGDILRRATAMIERGEIVPRVDPRGFSLDSVDDAHDAMASRAANGKVVVDVRG
jgi:NADPH2:quinone reductase